VNSYIITSHLLVIFISILKFVLGNVKLKMNFKIGGGILLVC